MINDDPLLKKMLPQKTASIQISYRRKGKNIKEMLATAKINQPDDRRKEGKQTECGRLCVFCPLMKETEGATFKSNQTRAVHKLRQNVDCRSTWVIYLVTCKRCEKQGVGSTEYFKDRVSNYKSTITNRKPGSCAIDHHFLQADHSWNDFSIMIIAKMEKEPKTRNQKERKKAFEQLRYFEGYWQNTLATIEPNGINNINELHRNKYSQNKPAFYGPTKPT